MTKDAQLKRNQQNKLNPRAEIGYLVRYDSTNIYRIWIPHTGKVISTRDVIFNETKFFNGKRTDLNAELIAEMDTLIQKIKLPAPQAFNEAILEEDKEVLKPVQLESNKSNAKTIKSDDKPDESDDKSIININD